MPISSNIPERSPVGSSTPGPSVGPLPFLGRDTELARLLDLYRRAYGGERIVARIAGEMGTGKTRLLQELCRSDEVARALVIRLRPGREEDADDRAALRAVLLESLESRPALRRRVAATLDASVDDGGLGRVLGAVARHTLLVLAIDDIDAGGERTARILSEVLHEVDAPLLVVASCVGVDNESLSRLARVCDAELIDLPLLPLDKGTLALLMTTLFGVRPGDQDLTWLSDHTRGLPLLLREAVHALLRAGCIAFSSGGWRYVHPFALCRFTPIDLFPLIGGRIAELNESQRAALATAALLGRRSPIAAYATFGFPEGWHLALVARDYLRADGRFIEFSHELLYEAALAEAQRRSLYELCREPLIRLIAGATEQDGGDVRFPRQTIRALLTGVEAERRPDLVATVVRAAIAAERRDEIGAAITYFTEARRWWREDRAAWEPAVLAAWMMRFASLLHYIGRSSEQQEVLEELLAEFTGYELTGDLLYHIIVTMLQLVDINQRAKRIETALEVLDRARATIGTVPEEESVRELELRIEERRAQIYYTLERRAEAIAICRRILDSWDGITLSPGVFDALGLLARVTFTVDEVAGLEEPLERMLALCISHNRQREAMQLRASQVGLFLVQQDFEGAEPKVRQLIAEAQQSHHVRIEGNAWIWLAIIHAERGDFVEGLRLVDRGIEIRWRVRSINMWQIAMLTKAQLQTFCGRDDDATATLDELDRDSEEYQRPHRRFIAEFCRRSIAVRRGAWETEQARLAELRAIGEEESFPEIDVIVYSLEGEILLAKPEVSVAEAADFANRVRDLEQLDRAGRMLRVTAVAIVGRAAVGKGKRRPRKGSEEGLREEVLGLLTGWQQTGAIGNVAHALAILRTHAPGFFTEDELAPFASMASAPMVEGPTYECTVVTFGRLRVVDTAGIERGGRHFGTHKSDSKPRKILAALAAAAVLGRRLTRSQLVDMVWDESISPDASANNFHVTLAGLRQVIGDGVDFDGSSYALQTSSVRVDALQFLAHLAEAKEAEREGRAFQAYDLLIDACELCSGEFLEGIYDEWSDRPRDLLRAEGRTARLRLAEIALQRGENDVARQTIVRQLESDPTDEEATYLHLTLLRSEGDRIRALREYERFAALLQGEYGVGPSKRLRALRDEIAAE